MRKPASADATALDAAGLTVHRITGELKGPFEALLSAQGILSDMYADEGPMQESPDLLAETDPDAAHVVLSMRLLARALLARALGRPFAPGPAGIDLAGVAADSSMGTRGVDEIARALAPGNLPRSIRPSRAQRDAAVDFVSRLLREVGLEEFDVSCYVGTDRDGAHALAAAPVSPETAHVWLLESLFERAEVAAVTGEPLLTAERDASSWEFARWSARSTRGRFRQAMEFTREVREQEYSLADRVTMALDASVIGDLMDTDGFAELFPRQHRMARALLESFTAVFECVSVSGSRAALRALGGGPTYEIHEHMAPASYAPGFIAFGRLLPFDGGLHIRSPGMIFVQPPDTEFAADLPGVLATLADQFPRALALEGTISAYVFGEMVPRTVKPARSRAEARTLLAAIQDLLGDRSREVAADVVPESLRALGEEREMRFLELDVDDTVAGFIHALVEQAGLGAGGEGTGRAKDARKQSAKKKTARKQQRRRR